MKPLSAWFSDLLIQISAVLESGVRLYCKGGVAKGFLIVLTSAIAVPIQDLFQRYVFSDWDFLFFIWVIITIDLFSGVYKASGVWDSTGKTPNSLSAKIFMNKVSLKIFVSHAWLVLVNFTKVYAETQSSFAATYSNYFGNLLVATWLMWSIAANLYVITKGKFPPIGLLRRLAAVNKSGDIRDIDKEPIVESELKSES